MKLDKYVIHLESSGQENFKNFLAVLEKGIVRLGVTGKMSWVLTATATPTASGLEVID